MEQSAIHYRVHKSPPVAPLLSPKRKSNHTLTFYFSKIHFNIISPSLPRSSKWSLPFRCPNWRSVWTFHLSHTLRTGRESRLSSFMRKNHEILRYVVLSSLLFSSSLRSSTSNTLSMYSCRVEDEVSQKIWLYVWCWLCKVKLSLCF